MKSKTLSRNTFLLLVALITIAFAGLLGGFMMSIFWATVIAILFYPMYDRWLIRLKGKKNAAAAMTLLIIVLLVVIPLTLIGFAVVNESIAYYQLIADQGIDYGAEFEKIRGSIPWDNKFFQTVGLTEAKVIANLNEASATLTRIVGERALGLTQNILGFIVQFVLMLYILYFFLRDGRKLVKDMIWALPLGDRIERRLFKRFESVVRATVKGSLSVAVLQGTLGGILFWAVGIPGAVMWGVVMIIASLLPVGNGLIWAPAGIILILTGLVAKGIIVLVVGVAFIGLIDNLLRPRLVGQDTKMPDYLILLSTLGGLSWFGITGFVIGPMIAAFFITSWELMGQNYGEGRRV